MPAWAVMSAAVLAARATASNAILALQASASNAILALQASASNAILASQASASNLSRISASAATVPVAGVCGWSPGDGLAGAGLLVRIAVPSASFASCCPSLASVPFRVFRARSMLPERLRFPVAAGLTHHSSLLCWLSLPPSHHSPGPSALGVVRRWPSCR